MSVRLDSLRKSFNDARSGIDAIENKARSASRDLSETEQAEVDTLLSRCEDLTPDIEAEGAREDRMSAAASVLARVQPKATAPALIRAQPSELPSIGQYMSLMIRSKQGDAEATELLTRTVATQTTTDTAGIIPVPILGPVIELADHRRPVFASFTSRPMPEAGKTFQRPQITQHVQVAQQSAELDELASRKMTISASAVTKLTIGGVLELSEQDIDFTDPAVLNIVISDFAAMYGEATEAKAVAALVALASTTTTYTSTTISTIIGSYMAAVQAVYASSKRMPDTVWMSLDSMFTVAGVSNSTTNVTALTLLKQALADAGVGLNFVVAPTLPSGTIIVGASSLVESYEKVKGLLTAPDVSHLGVVIGYRGYMATYGLAAGFTKLA